MAGGAAAGAGLSRRVLAMFDDGSIVVQDHKIDADKELSAGWKRSLTNKGAKEVWSGAALDSIGMPVGGIAAGQLYLKGEGTLGWWEIFNHHQFLGYGLTSYAKRPVPRSVQFWFTVSVDGEARMLGAEDFPGTTFDGRYPMGINTYPFDDRALITQTAYSPFIPLNAKDSALPATIFELDILNTSKESLEIEVDGYLENAVSRSAERDPENRKRWTQWLEKPLVGFLLGADAAKDDFSADEGEARAVVILADFEGDDYGDWKVEGEAFGSGPARGTLANQQQVTGFEGKGLVNSFLRGDDTTGKLTSPTFTISRRMINFKIGGGNQPGKACINLMVGGKAVRTSTGLNDERLLWDTWDVREFEGQEAHIEIVDEATGGWGHINIDHIEQSDRMRSLEDYKLRHESRNRDHGTMALCVSGMNAEAGKAATYGFASAVVSQLHGKAFSLKPGERRKITFVLAWHFPHHARGREYASRFGDAESVAKYVADNLERLARQTREWVDAYYETSLPYWLLDRLASTNSYLATGTTEWWGDGRFWAWEGVVCCEGTCTHVWNYEHGMARLFPELERNVRHRQDFGAGFDEASGLVGFRGNRAYAADGQCGTVLKAYREHLTSADDSFLKEHWLSIKKALLYSIGHDANADGIIEDRQHNTFDIDFYGANTFVGSLYLGALRAGEEMAKEMGDADFAKFCRQIYEKGRDNTMDRLWNGEYFVQKVDEQTHKEYQYGPGCLSDQMFGQGWAHQVGLGHLYPADKVKKALQSVWTYNFSTNVGAYNERWKPERPFAVGNEAGLFICTWPKGGRQDEPVRYRDEIWTGIEYQVAGHMIWEGLVEEGLSVCKAIHERYHPAKRNPYNEVECSDHYARAMASWGVFTALAGFEYHGPKGIMGFAPRVNPTRFKTVYTAAEGWGVFEQTSEGCTLDVKQGQLRLTELRLAQARAKAKVEFPGASGIRVESRDGMLTVKFGRPIVLKAGGPALKIRFE